MQYPFPKLKTYTRMSRAQLGQAYTNLERHFGRREHLPAPLNDRPDLQNDLQRAAMHMDMLLRKFKRADMRKNVQREQIANRTQLQKGLYIGMVGMVGVVALALTKRYLTTDPKRALDAYQSDLRTAKSAYDNMIADNISPIIAGRMLDDANSVALQRFAARTKT